MSLNFCVPRVQLKCYTCSCSHFTHNGPVSASARDNHQLAHSIASPTGLSEDSTFLSGNTRRVIPGPVTLVPRDSTQIRLSRISQVRDIFSLLGTYFNVVCGDIPPLLTMTRGSASPPLVGVFRITKMVTASERNQWSFHHLD